ncbi:MAG TPA: cellulose biosynthesis protein BcsS [Hyphomicrobium sp.]|nr:cellulose biosynthesis protein BcsS [Hyphomicrobium sp.]
MLAGCTFQVPAVRADDANPYQPDAPEQRYGWREVWGGADATRDVWLLYTGVTLAPLSKDIYSDGVRLRVNSGYGQYQFDERKTNCVDKPGLSCFARLTVDVAYTDALIGYHLRLGELTAKAFAGASMVSHSFGNQISDNAVQGMAFGATGGLEFWLNLGNDGWTSLDLLYTTAHGTGSARWRAGWRVIPTLSIGPEVRHDRNDEGDASRVGAFARYDWVGGEISVAAGISGTIADVKGDELQPYATLNLLTQF